MNNFRILTIYPPPFLLSRQMRSLLAAASTKHYFLIRRVLLMAKPSWFDSSNQIWELSRGPPDSTTSNVLNLKQLRGLWLISFVQDMRTLRASSSQLRLT